MDHQKNTNKYPIEEKEGEYEVSSHFEWYLFGGMQFITIGIRWFYFHPSGTFIPFLPATMSIGRVSLSVSIIDLLILFCLVLLTLLFTFSIFSQEKFQRQ